MRKIFFIIVCAIVCTSLNAQVIKVYKNGNETPEAIYHNTAKRKYRVVFEEKPAVDPQLLSGKFSVSSTKQVQFAKGNLYWDGDDFQFEANQTDYQTEWYDNHINLFYWNSYNDFDYDVMPYDEGHGSTGLSEIGEFGVDKTIN